MINISKIVLVLKQAMFLIVLLGVVFQSTAQTLSFLTDIELENSIGEFEEDPEEEESNKKEVNEEKIKSTSSRFLFIKNVINKDILIVKDQNSNLDFVLEIPIAPPDKAS